MKLTKGERFLLQLNNLLKKYDARIFIDDSNIGEYSIVIHVDKEEIIGGDDMFTDTQFEYDWEKRIQEIKNKLTEHTTTVKCPCCNCYNIKLVQSSSLLIRRADEYGNSLPSPMQNTYKCNACNKTFMITVDEPEKHDYKIRK